MVITETMLFKLMKRRLACQVFIHRQLVMLREGSVENKNAYILKKGGDEDVRRAHSGQRSDLLACDGRGNGPPPVQIKIELIIFVLFQSREDNERKGDVSYRLAPEDGDGLFNIADLA